MSWSVDYWFEEAEIAAEKSGKKPKEYAPSMVYSVSPRGDMSSWKRHDDRRKKRKR